MTSSGRRRYNGLYPGFSNESVLLIGLKSLSPDLKTILLFALANQMLPFMVKSGIKAILLLALS